MRPGEHHHLRLDDRMQVPERIPGQASPLLSAGEDSRDCAAGHDSGFITWSRCPIFPTTTMVPSASRMTPAGELRRVVVHVVGRRDFDHFIPHNPSRAMRRTSSSASRGFSPPGSGVPVPGAKPGSMESMS